MANELLLWLFLVQPQLAGSPPPTHATAALLEQQQDPEFDKRRKAAGNDVDKLWDVYKWCKEQKKDEKGRSVLRQLLKIDPLHEDANLALGNVKYDGKWFPSQKKVDEYKKEQEAKQTKEKDKGGDGLVDYKGKRVPPEDVPFLEKGLVKDDAGNWVNAEDKKKLAEGWVRQDLEWIKPEEKANVESGQWKCGDKWLALADANKLHSTLYQWWRIPSDHYWLYTTCDRNVALEKVKLHLDRAWDDAVKVAGIEPKEPIIVVILRDDRQYNTFAAGDEEEEIPHTDPRGLSGVHYSFFSEIAGDPVTGKPMHAGVGYWDVAATNGDAFGVHSVRSALGLSYADAVDPSPKTWEKAMKSKTINQGFIKDYYEEKRFPEWLRTGLSTYTERYYIDTHAAKARWAVEWSVQNIVGKGGMRPLKQIFEGELRPGDDTPKLMNEMGLVVAFIVDGGCAPLKDKLKELQEALKAGKDKKEIAALTLALSQDVMKHETELRKFAGL